MVDSINSTDYFEQGIQFDNNSQLALHLKINLKFHLVTPECLLVIKPEFLN